MWGDVVEGCNLYLGSRLFLNSISAQGLFCGFTGVYQEVLQSRVHCTDEED